MAVNRKLQYELLNQNTRYSFIDGIGFSIMMGATAPYIGLLILRLNGTSELVNLIASLQPVIVSVISLLAASYANNLTRTHPALMRYSLALRLFFPLMACIPLFNPSVRAGMFFALWLLIYIPWALCGLLWSPMISTMIPDENRGRFFGTRNAVTGITTLLGTFLTGVALAELPFSTAFSLIFWVSFASTMISLYYLNKQIEPLMDPVEVPGTTPETASPKISYWRNLDLKANFLTFTHPQCGYLFSLCCVTFFVFHIGFSMAGPLFTLRQIQQLGLNNGAIATIATLTSLTALFGSYAGGIASERWGYRYVLLGSTLLATVPPIIWALSGSFFWVVIASMGWGFIGNAYFICFFYMVLAFSPDEGRARFVAMNTVTGNLAGAIGPFLGMFLMKIPWLGIQGSLVAASTIMLFGAAFSYYVAKKGTF
jgi:MFS family permease